MTTVNFLAVKAYGELEFWFALIKILAIVLMIAVGLLMIVFGIGNGGVATGIKTCGTMADCSRTDSKVFCCRYKWSMFAYLGIEMIGVTAGEGKIQKNL